MLAIAENSCPELSTPSPRGAPLAHNQRMNDADTDGGLARFLTLADTAELLNITTTQAYALVRSGELPAIKVGAGGQWRIERDVLESYIQAMYEETRRMNLWNQGDYANLTEIAFGDRT